MRNIEFIKEIERLLLLKRQYGVSTEEILKLICQRQGYKLRRNKRSWNIKFG